jgi:hypothetical protein
VRTLNLSLDTLLSVLSNRRRRLTLETLATRSPPVTVRTLAEDVQTRERDAGAEPADASLDAIETSLYHVHLPALDSAGLVTFDTGREAVVAVSEDVDAIVQ